MNGHISVEARTKLAYDDLIVMSRLNPDHFQVHPSGQNKLLLIFLSPRPGWFYSYDRQGLVDSVHLEITFLPDQVTPHIRLLDPRPYHPNISQNEGGVLNINIMTRKDLKSQEKLTHLVAFIWDLLTYQFVDQNKILNENANKWYRKFRNNFPLTQMVLQLPPSSSGFHIISRSSPSTPLADFNHPKDVPSAIGEQNTLPQKNILPLTESIDTQNQQGYPNPKSNQEKPIESPSSTALSTGFKVKSIRKYAPPKQTFPADSSHENINWKYPVILVPQSVWNKILIHGSSAIGKEQFGILIGTVFENQNTNGVWLNVLDMVPATRPERSSLTYVEVSADEMAEMVRRSEFILDQNPNSCRLGWYHTHPGHGIFMSGTDKANHRAVYRTNWQVALVYDPNNHQFGFFSGLECTLIPANNIILVPDVTPTDKVIQPGYKETVSENIPTIRVPQKEPILIPEHSLGGSTPVTQHNSIPLTKP